MSHAADIATIRALIASVDKGHHDKDAKAIAAAYSEEAVIADLAPPLVRTGIDANRMANWLNTWEGPVERTAHDMRIAIDGDLAFALGYYRLSGVLKRLGQKVSFWMRATVCLKRTGSGWQIVHEHTSVPFYMDDSLRPAFDIEP
jgi:ketosteroid isomerase-like protein